MGCGIVEVWEKYQKLIVGWGGGGGGWNSRPGWTKVKILIVRGGRGWLLNCFFLFFSNHENDSIKNICVYSKSKIKTKVTNKQNLQNFKMINWRLFSHKFFKNSEMLLLSSWTIFIRSLAFLFSPRANFYSLKYLCFSFILVFQFILISTNTLFFVNNPFLTLVPKIV